MPDLLDAELDEIEASGLALKPRRARALVAEVRMLREETHYANGVAELAMKHRDEAESDRDAALADAGRMRDGLQLIKSMKPSRIGDSGFVHGPALLLSNAQRIARDAIAGRSLDAYLDHDDVRAILAEADAKEGR